MSRNNLSGKAVGDKVATFITVDDVWDFIDRIRDQEKRWSFFEVETFVTEVRGKFFFEVEVKTGKEVCRSPMGIRISGFEGSPVTAIVDDINYGSEESVSTTLKDFSEAIEGVSKRKEQLEEFIRICNFIKSLVRYPDNQKGHNDK